MAWALALIRALSLGRTLTAPHSQQKPQPQLQVMAWQPSIFWMNVWHHPGPRSAGTPTKPQTYVGATGVAAASSSESSTVTRERIRLL